MEAAQEKASKVASSAADSTTKVGSEVVDRGTEVMHEAKQQMQSLVDSAKDEVRTQARDRGEQAASSMRTLSSQLGSLAAGRTEEAGRLPLYLHEAELRLQSMAERLQDRGPEGILVDLSNFARRRPGTFLVGAALAGFAAGRIVRTGVATRSDGSGPNGAYALPACPFSVSAMAATAATSSVDT